MKLGATFRGHAAPSLQRRVFSSYSPPNDYVPSQFDQEILHKYVIGQLIGSGSFGNVYRATPLSRGDGSSPSLDVAIKAMPKKKCPFALTECQLLSKVSLGGNPHVLKFIEVLESTHMVYLVTELLRGPELFQVLVERETPFSEVDTLRFVKQMLEAVEACHKMDFAHIDVKIENMVFRHPDVNRSELVLVDFGAAQPFIQAPYATGKETYKDGLDDQMLHITRPAGTIPYNSPEVLNGLFSSRSDVWSVGVSMFVLLTGKRPFDSVRALRLEAEQSIKRQIHGAASERVFPPLPKEISTQTRLLLQGLTAVNPRERLSATEALKYLQTL